MVTLSELQEEFDGESDGDVDVDDPIHILLSAVGQLSTAKIHCTALEAEFEDVEEDYVGKIMFALATYASSQDIDLQEVVDEQFEQYQQYNEARDDIDTMLENLFSAEDEGGVDEVFGSLLSEDSNIDGVEIDVE